MSTAYLILRFICYAALAVVTLGIAGMFVVSHPEVCSSFSTGAISCRSEGVEELATLIMGILLVSAFTGVPVLLALFGLFFLLRAAAPKIAQLYRMGRPAQPAANEVPDTGAPQRTALQKLGRAGKVVAIILGLFFLSAVLAGIYQASVQ